MAAAVTVMRAEGLESVTMRRLATELDTGPASLYVYVQNTAEIARRRARRDARPGGVRP